MRAFTLLALLCIFLSLRVVDACESDTDCTSTGSGLVTCTSGSCVCEIGSYLNESIILVDNYLWSSTSHYRWWNLFPDLGASDFNNVDVSSMINQTTDKFYNDVYLKFDVKYSSDERGFPIIEYCQVNDNKGWQLYKN